MLTWAKRSAVSIQKLFADNADVTAFVKPLFAHQGLEFYDI